MKEIRSLLIIVLLLYGVIAGFRVSDMGMAVAITIIIQALCLLYAIYLTYKKDK